MLSGHPLQELSPKLDENTTGAPHGSMFCFDVGEHLPRFGMPSLEFVADTVLVVF